MVQLQEDTFVVSYENYKKLQLGLYLLLHSKLNLDHILILLTLIVNVRVDRLSKSVRDKKRVRV